MRGRDSITICERKLETRLSDCQNTSIQQQQQQHEYQAGRTEEMAFKRPDQPLETHEKKTVPAVIQSIHLRCSGGICKVCLKCFHVFPMGFRTKRIRNKK